MREEYVNILRSFYQKLFYQIFQNNKGRDIQNDSILWSITQMNKKNIDKFFRRSIQSADNFELEDLSFLKDLGLIQYYNETNREFVLTAKGLWEYEKSIKGFNEETLISFINSKYLSFSISSLDDKDRLTIFTLLCIRNFSSDTAMDLTVISQRASWYAIFEEVFIFMNNNKILKKAYLGFDEILLKTKLNHPIQDMLRHRNDLPVNSGQLFVNPGGKSGSNYWLDILDNDIVSENKLKNAFKLVISEIPDLDTATMIISFCREMANYKAKYVRSDFRFIDIQTDNLIDKVIKDIYIGK